MFKLPLALFCFVRSVFVFFFQVFLYFFVLIPSFVELLEAVWITVGDHSSSWTTTPPIHLISSVFHGFWAPIIHHAEKKEDETHPPPRSDMGQVHVLFFLFFFLFILFSCFICCTASTASVSCREVCVCLDVCMWIERLTAAEWKHDLVDLFLFFSFFFRLQSWNNWPKTNSKCMPAFNPTSNQTKKVKTSSYM